MYDFLIVVNETTGNFVNVSVMPYVDIVISSLTTVKCSVVTPTSWVEGVSCMSAIIDHCYHSLVINPYGCHYVTLKSILQGSYEDVYFDEDVIFMEHNSCNFKQCVQAINNNAEAV